MNFTNTNNHYQVGGSLSTNATCYVVRQADQELLEHLEKGDFCYVFNSRQMGKSSLLVRTKQILKEQGWQATTVDMSVIGSEDVTVEQWYLGIMSNLYKNLRLGTVNNFLQWYKTKENISLIQIFSQFIEEILFTDIPDKNIVIFVDEIDSILSLKFPVDDFFSLIRFCYNQRATNPHYQRLTFALFGVATPTDLIKDKKRTPFNIGNPINLTGFTLVESQPLLQGLPEGINHPQILLREILNWTGGQPFLTQKVCQFVTDTFNYEDNLNDETSIISWVSNLIQEKIINNWEGQDEPEHLRTIRDRINYQTIFKARILGMYQVILAEEKILNDQSEEQTELILSGLVVKQGEYLRVKNRIYASVFNLDWVSRELSALRPYSQALSAWLYSQQKDESRLLRGQALQDALKWTQGKSLSDLDYKFIAASTAINQREIQQKLEADQARIIEEQLQREKQNSRSQKILSVLLSIAFLIVSTLAIITYQAYHQSAISEIKALVASSIGLFASDHQLEAMLAGIEAKRKFEKLGIEDDALAQQVETALNTTIYGTTEVNRLIGHQGGVYGAAISPDNQFIATSSSDKTAKIWQKDGKLLHTLIHPTTLRLLAVSPDSQLIITAGQNILYVWQKDGQLVKEIITDQETILGLTISPDGQYIASSGLNFTIKLWNLDGQLVTTITDQNVVNWDISFSPDSQKFATAGSDATVKIWNLEGKLLKTLVGHKNSVWDVAFCSNDTLVSVSGDKTGRIWRTDGTLLNILETHYSLFNTDCQNGAIATAGSDNVIQIWQTDGTLINYLRKHQANIYNFNFNRNADLLVSASEDGVVKLWQQNKQFIKPIYAYEEKIWDVATSPNSQIFVSVNMGKGIKVWDIDQEKNISYRNQSSEDLLTDQQVVAVAISADNEKMVTGNLEGQVKIWDLGNTNQSQLKLLKTLPQENAVLAIAISPDQEIIASAGNNGNIKLWDFQGNLLRKFPAHAEAIWRLAFSPDSQLLVSASADHTAKIWTKEGELLQTLQHNGIISGVDFHPITNQVITASSDDTIKFWNLDGKLAKSIVANSHGLMRIVVSPDGQFIATAGFDGMVKLWNSDGQLLAVLPGHNSSVLALTMSADGQYIISGGADGLLIVWNLPQIFALKNLEYACDWVKDYLHNSTELTDSQRHLCDGVNS